MLNSSNGKSLESPTTYNLSLCNIHCVNVAKRLNVSGNFKPDTTMGIFKNLFGRQGGHPITAQHKVVCAWIGTFESEKDFYANYLSFKSADEEEDNLDLSEFAIDANIGWYDEDFIESWWFEKLEINKLQEYRTALLDSEYFFDDLIAELKTCDISNYNIITFLFGKKGVNEMLFHYKNPFRKNVPIKFILKKQYEKQP